MHRRNTYGVTAMCILLHHDIFAYSVPVYANLNLHIIAYLSLCIFQHIMHIWSYKTHIYAYFEMHIYAYLVLHFVHILCIFMHMVILHICAYFAFA